MAYGEIMKKQKYVLALHMLEMNTVRLLSISYHEPRSIWNLPVKIFLVGLREFCDDSPPPSWLVRSIPECENKYNTCLDSRAIAEKAGGTKKKKKSLEFCVDSKNF